MSVTRYEPVSVKGELLIKRKMSASDVHLNLFQKTGEKYWRRFAAETKSP